MRPRDLLRLPEHADHRRRKRPQLTGEGFEIGLHSSTNCENWSSRSQLEGLYSTQLARIHGELPERSRRRRRTAPTASPGATGRRSRRSSSTNGIRLDTNYYYWPASWVQDRPGMFTGSGMPMRFADLNGSLIDVYQAPTQMTDESDQSYPATIDALLDNALGPKGYYGVFTANMHTDVDRPRRTPTRSSHSALERGVPVVSARQMLTWLDGRNQSSFDSIQWADGKLQFSISPGPRAHRPEGDGSGELLGRRTRIDSTRRNRGPGDDARRSRESNTPSSTRRPAATWRPTPPRAAAAEPDLDRPALAGEQQQPENHRHGDLPAPRQDLPGARMYRRPGRDRNSGPARHRPDRVRSPTTRLDSFTATVSTTAEETSECSSPLTYIEDSTAPDHPDRLKPPGD